MEHRHLLAERREARPEAPDRLGGQRDLWHQHQHRAAAPQHVRGSLQIDLGLARAGHAVEEEGRGGSGFGGGRRAPLRRALLGGRLDGGQGGGLFVGQGQGGGLDQGGAVGLGVAVDGLLGQGDPAAGDQGAERGGGARAEVGDGDPAVRGGGQQDDQRVLARGAGGEPGELVGGRVGGEGGEAAGLGAVVLGAHGLGQQRAHHRFHTASIVVGDPAPDLQQGGGDQRLGVVERGDLAQREPGRRLVAERQHGAGRGLRAQRDGDPAAGRHRHAVRHGVVEHQLRGAVDQDAGGGHGGGVLRA